MSDGLVVNDYSFLQYGSTVFDHTPKRRKRRPRSVSPKNRGRSSSAARRARSAGSAYKSTERLYSVNGTRRDRSTSPNAAVYSHFARQPYNHLDYYCTDDGKLVEAFSFKAFFFLITFKYLSRNSLY